MDERQFPTKVEDGYLEAATVCEFEAVRTNPETGRTVARYDRETVPLSLAVPALVAERSGVDPTSLPPMYDRLDVDALERVVGGERRGGSETRVRFEYAGYAVTVGHGRVTVQPAEPGR